MTHRKNLPVLAALLIIALLSIPASADEPFIPPEYGIIPVDETIDNVRPDETVTREFFGSPLHPVILDCLRYHDNLSVIPRETQSLVLENIEYYVSEEQSVRRNITVGELLADMKTPFPGLAWFDSYINCFTGAPAWKKDLKNAYTFAQEMAKRNGFENGIPLRFANMKFSIDGGGGTVSVQTDTSPEPAVQPDTGTLLTRIGGASAALPIPGWHIQNTIRMHTR